MSAFVVRLGAFFLQGVNAWGQRSCADVFETACAAKRAAKGIEFAVVEPADGTEIVHRDASPPKPGTGGEP